MIKSVESVSETYAPLLAFFADNKNVPNVVLQSAKFFQFFADTIYPLLETYRTILAPLYSACMGRPAEDPVRLLAILILQFVQRVPDRQAAEAVQYDLRWRQALHMDLNEATFHPTLLTKFRARLLNGDQERLAFDAVLNHLVSAGLVPKRCKQRLDSTHVCGLLAHMSRLECARETIRLTLEALDFLQKLPDAWTLWWEQYVETKPDHRAGVETLKAKILQAGKDMYAILQWAEEQDTAVKDHEHIRLLRRVFTENYEMNTAGELQHTRTQPTGAVQNPHEPEAQWSSKSTTKDKTWIGTKVQVAETVQDEPCNKGEPTRNFITAIVTQNATESDKAGLAQVMTEQKEMGLEPPSALYVDGAYVSSHALYEAQQDGRELRGPAPASPDRGKVFTVERFDVHTEDRFAVCPAGHSSTNFSCLHVAHTGRVDYRIEWNNTICGDCPLFRQCVSEKQSHRTILVGEHHDLLQTRRREMGTDAFKIEMHRRNGIEGTQSEMIRAFGLRHARYRGNANIRLQNYLIGAACNIRRLFRRLMWEVNRGLAVGAALAG